MFHKMIDKDDEVSGKPVTIQVPDYDKVFMNSWNLKQVIVVEG